MARMLERDEVEKLQTLPEDYTIMLNKTNAHKVIGNGWTIDVIAHLFKTLKESPNFTQSLSEIGFVSQNSINKDYAKLNQRAKNVKLYFQ